MSRSLPSLAVSVLFVATGCNGIAGTNPDCTYAVPECAPPAGLPYDAAAPPNVMLLVDKSGSMGEPGTCDAAPCGSKWDQLMTLTPYVGEIEATGALGLTLFPAPQARDSCDVKEGIAVPIGEQTAAQVLAVLERETPSGMTPLAASLDLLRKRACLAHPVRDNVVILLTDGVPNCACRGDGACERKAAVKAASRLANDAPDPVELYVVGFGRSAEDATETLEAVAAAAAPTSGTDNFYRAGTVEELAERMYRIGGQLGGCTYVLDDAVDPEMLWVYVEDDAVERCTGIPCESGWTTDDGKAIRLHGVACRLAAAPECPPVRFELEG